MSKFIFVKELTNGTYGEYDERMKYPAPSLIDADLTIAICPYSYTYNKDSLTITKVTAYKIHLNNNVLHNHDILIDSNEYERLCIELKKDNSYEKI